MSENKKDYSNITVFKTNNLSGTSIKVVKPVNLKIFTTESALTDADIKAWWKRETGYEAKEMTVIEL